MAGDRILTLPNYLCFIRLLSAPVLLVLAWMQQPAAFIGLTMLAFALDAVDGPVARRLHQESTLGPKLDSWADASVYLSLPLGIWWLWPELILRELIYVLLILGSILVPLIVGLARFRRPTSYHTWMVKLAATVTALATLALLLWGLAWPVRLASLVCVVAGLEEVLITLVLPRPQSDVRSLVHVLRQSRR